MYQGKGKVAEEDLPSFIKLAEDLKISELSELNRQQCDVNFVKIKKYDGRSNTAKEIRQEKKDNLYKITEQYSFHPKITKQDNNENKT